MSFVLASNEVPVSHVAWRPCYRLIASRYPTVGVYDGIADAGDLEVVFAIEALTNPRLRDALGQLHLVPLEQRISGPGSTPIMAAFTHLNPHGSRFSKGHYGVYYAAESLETAVAEVGYHRSVFLARTAEPAIDIDLRLIVAELAADLHDLRTLRSRHPALYDPQDYGAAQALGHALRASGSPGVVYHSVRREEGVCVGLFLPKALQPARSDAHLALHWDGSRITHWYRKDTPHLVA